MQRLYQLFQVLTPWERFALAIAGSIILFVVAIIATTRAEAAIRVVLPDGSELSSPAVEYVPGAQPTVYVGGVLFSGGFE